MTRERSAAEVEAVARKRFESNPFHDYKKPGNPRYDTWDAFAAAEPNDAEIELRYVAEVMAAADAVAAPGVGVTVSEFAYALTVAIGTALGVGAMSLNPENAARTKKAKEELRERKQHVFNLFCALLTAQPKATVDTAIAEHAIESARALLLQLPLEQMAGASLASLDVVSAMMTTLDEAIFAWDDAQPGTDGGAE